MHFKFAVSYQMHRESKLKDSIFSYCVLAKHKFYILLSFLLSHVGACAVHLFIYMKT